MAYNPTRVVMRMMTRNCYVLKNDIIQALYTD